MLVRLVYASRAKATLTPAQFDDILAVSRRNNPANGITGVLCTNTFIFLQMLEGGRKEVSETTTRIASDPRHQERAAAALPRKSCRASSLTGQWAKVSFDRLNMAVLLKHSAKAVLDPTRVGRGVGRLDRRADADGGGLLSCRWR